MANEPRSVEDWLHLCQQHEITARSVVENRVACAQAMHHAGFAVECALKAYIWKAERFNRWPSRADRPDLYTHSLLELQRIAGIVVDPSQPTAPGWHIMLQWQRHQGYDPKPMPVRVARSYIEASFGEEGVVTWIRQTLTPSS